MSFVSGDIEMNCPICMCEDNDRYWPCTHFGYPTIHICGMCYDELHLEQESLGNRGRLKPKYEKQIKEGLVTI